MRLAIRATRPRNSLRLLLRATRDQIMDGPIANGPAFYKFFLPVISRKQMCDIKNIIESMIKLFIDSFLYLFKLHVKLYIGNIFLIEKVEL
ncbi:hypothetical protein ACJIZ3_014146 [Penstemon smallii]|uniref:Uncharacterized protein n=1 Tax=Penstemon smallii TaxID=265156 RepID=A0ABD3RJ32_9LAMI